MAEITNFIERNNIKKLLDKIESTNNLITDLHYESQISEKEYKDLTNQFESLQTKLYLKLLRFEKKQSKIR